MNVINESGVRLSACIVAHNEEKLIGRCLKSIKGVVDEVIVVHDGACEDRTLEIAKDYSARIIVAPRTGEAEPIRPLSYEAARGEWILQIDADEFLSEELRQAIPTLLARSDIDAYECIWPIYHGGRYVSKTWPHKRCLFRRDKVFFLGLVHYVVGVSGRIERLPLRLEHQPLYDNFSRPVFSKKWRRWAGLQARYYLQDFKDISKYNYPEKRWPLTVRVRRKLPLIMLPLDGLIVLLRVVFSSHIFSFWAWKVALYTASWRMLVDWLIFRYRFYPL